MSIQLTIAYSTHNKYQVIKYHCLQVCLHYQQLAIEPTFDGGHYHRDKLTPYL
jgi:hypothetical protein